MNSVVLFVLLCFVGSVTCIFSTIPAANSCTNLTSAFNMNLTKLNGSWYVQKYTGPVNMDLQTKCDLFTFNITSNGTYGSINYTYESTKDDSQTFQLATLVSLPQNGKYEYQITVSDIVVRMNTTIVVMQDDTAFVHVACTEGPETSSTVVIATRAMEPNADIIRNLEMLAIKQGASDYNLQQTDLTNCTFPPPPPSEGQTF